MRLLPRATPTHLIPGCCVRRRSLIGLNRARTLMSPKARRICRGRCYLPWDGNAVPYSARQKSPGCRHLHFESEPSRTRRACRQCRIHGSERCARAGSGAKHGRAFSCRGASLRLSCNAIQFCRLHQRIGDPPLAASGFQDRRHFARGVPASRKGYVDVYVMFRAL